MTKTLEFPASKMVEKIQSGEIPPMTYVWVTLDVPEETPINEEAEREVASWKHFIEDHGVAGIVVDDSRESFYEGDTDW